MGRQGVIGRRSFLIGLGAVASCGLPFGNTKLLAAEMAKRPATCVLLSADHMIIAEPQKAMMTLTPTGNVMAWRGTFNFDFVYSVERVEKIMLIVPETPWRKRCVRYEDSSTTVGLPLKPNGGNIVVQY